MYFHYVNFEMLGISAYNLFLHVMMLNAEHSSRQPFGGLQMVMSGTGTEYIVEKDWGQICTPSSAGGSRCVMCSMCDSAKDGR